ncbi:GL20143 [Drosophila persimilis]|uniref:GL20143 n=1 Tax=Drosophila persimilis TaxID=7234 RepID=B4GY57_DROPE|nr:GL20143 [Drosophila persimilis]
MGDNKFEIPHEWIVEFVEELDKILTYLNVELEKAMNSKPVLKMESLEELILDLDDNMHALAITW